MEKIQHKVNFFALPAVCLFLFSPFLSHSSSLVFNLTIVTNCICQDKLVCNFYSGLLFPAFIKRQIGTAEVREYTKYGKNYCKTKRLHPDAYCQMAMQLGYYRLYKRYDQVTAICLLFLKTSSISC